MIYFLSIICAVIAATIVFSFLKMREAASKDTTVRPPLALFKITLATSLFTFTSLFLGPAPASLLLYCWIAVYTALMVSSAIALKRAAWLTSAENPDMTGWARMGTLNFLLCAALIPFICDVAVSSINGVANWTAVSSVLAIGIVFQGVLGIRGSILAEQGLRNEEAAAAKAEKK